MKVAIYCRLSEEDKNKVNQSDDSNSIKNQKVMLLEYAMTQGWEVYNIYSDDDYAGADRNRPEFKRLIEDAEKHLFDIVLCKTQSRFTRELELVEKYIHGLFPALGIRFVSIVDNADTANKGNKKSRQINGLVNEWYLEDMSENIKSVLTSRRKNGFHIGAFALYGYMKDPDRIRKRIINEVDFENTTIFSISKNIIAIKPVDASDKTKELFKSFLGSMCFSVLLVDDILLFMLVTNKEGTNELIAELQEMIDEAAEETKLRYRAVSCVESTQPFKVSKEKKQQRRRQARINAALQEELE